MPKACQNSSGFGGEHGNLLKEFSLPRTKMRGLLCAELSATCRRSRICKASFHAALRSGQQHFFFGRLHCGGDFDALKHRRFRGARQGVRIDRFRHLPKNYSPQKKAPAHGAEALVGWMRRGGISRRLPFPCRFSDRPSSCRGGLCRDRRSP